jgi:hypothetical protein
MNKLERLETPNAFPGESRDERSVAIPPDRIVL